MGRIPGLPEIARDKYLVSNAPGTIYKDLIIYESYGKQFIAIACGGEKLGTLKGKQIVSFSL